MSVDIQSSPNPTSSRLPPRVRLLLVHCKEIQTHQTQDRFVDVVLLLSDFPLSTVILLPPCSPQAFLSLRPSPSPVLAPVKSPWSTATNARAHATVTMTWSPTSSLCR